MVYNDYGFETKNFYYEYFMKYIAFLRSLICKILLPFYNYTSVSTKLKKYKCPVSKIIRDVEKVPVQCETKQTINNTNQDGTSNSNVSNIVDNKIQNDIPNKQESNNVKSESCKIIPNYYYPDEAKIVCEESGCKFI